MRLVGTSGWNACHFAVYYGYTEILIELIQKKINLNITTTDNWTPLHLAAYKGNEDIVKVLMNEDKIDINVNIPGGIGTPLHCACKRNNLKVVSLLLFKADTDIKDSNSQVAVSLATDKNIIRLIEKTVNVKKQKILNENNNNPNTNNNDIKNYSFLKHFSFIPPKPPKTFGFIEKMGQFIFNYNLRFIEVDALGGSLKRYKNYEDYPNSPHDIIPLRDITICKRINSIYYSSKYYYFELNYEQRQVYRLNSEESCNKWIEVLNSAIIYSKFFLGLLEKNSIVVEYFSKLKEEKVYIDYYKEIDDQYKKQNKFNKATKNKLSNDKSKNNENSSSSKKKERRKNPYNQQNTLESEEELKLSEDSTLIHGITYDSFIIISTLGSGTFGKVFKVKLKSNGNIYAMKVINKKYLIRNQQLRYAVTECNVLKQINHPYIITLHYAFQTPDHLYMILDYCPGGDLSFHIVKNLFEENEAEFFIAELLLAIEHLHSHDIIYRDLKPENILVDSEGHIKLADFGLAKENVANDKITQSFCGSPAYLAPEMVNRRGVGKAADIYGIGACLYEMISGTPPFYAQDLNTMYKQIANNKLMLHDYFSDELKSLLKKLLSRDPKARIGLSEKDEIKNHEFFANIDWEKLYHRKIKPPIDLNDYKPEEKHEEKINFKDIDYIEDNSDYNRVKNFTFLRSPKDSKGI